MRGAWLHLGADALGSLGAMVAAVIILGWDIHRADPAISLLIGVLVLWAAWRLLRDTTHVLLEAAARGMDPGAVARTLSEEDGVVSVHHLHLWSVASDLPAMSAHVVLAADTSMHEAQLKADHLKALLSERFGIEHATLELECHEHPAAEHGERP